MQAAVRHSDTPDIHITVRSTTLLYVPATTVGTSNRRQKFNSNFKIYHSIPLDKRQSNLAIRASLKEKKLENDSDSRTLK